MADIVGFGVGVCVRPRAAVPVADLMAVGDEAVGDLPWLAQDADEIAEQYRRDRLDSGTRV
ncbi:hypothetical protein ACFVKB_43070 [Rhodococcus sp. NPDC127530]|uniref:hypothetical protein n=1 Tax=unclassified Rhodococcus (in: high G+C Gram-positive bacteria) TaxID=192944 RepID=UPI0036280F7E